MLREVRVDVPLQRVVAVVPQAVFIPIFRALPALQERDFGFFAPIWDVEQANPNGEERFLDLPGLPPITEAPEQASLLPFLAANPLLPGRKARNTPGLSKALTLCRKAGGNPREVWQHRSQDRPELPMDLRKWPSAEANTYVSEDGLLDKPGGVDVLVTQFLLWNHAVTPAPLHADALLARAFQNLHPHGVWYLQELLAPDMHAHWVYQFFPGVWDWVRRNTWNLHTLYNQFVGAGFKVKEKRTTFLQPIALGAAFQIAQKRPGILAALSQSDFERGISALCEEGERQGDDHQIYSEATMIEVWAQKEGEQ
ncbi:MAG: hypothetical protein ACE5GO_09280 [Anaerolineales bacterium]